MRRLLLISAAAVAAILVPRAALAVDLAPPLPEVRAVLAYGASYAYEGATRTHTGTDLAAEAGEGVRAPGSGTVAFAGSVPAGDGEGSLLAVTLALSDGLRITLMPFSRLDVVRGQQIETGARLGDLGERGDPSSAEAHLHVGATRNGARLDPMTLLSATPEAPDTQPDSASEGVEAAVPAPAKPAEEAAGVRVSGRVTQAPVRTPSAATAAPAVGVRARVAGTQAVSGGASAAAQTGAAPQTTAARPEAGATAGGSVGAAKADESPWYSPRTTLPAPLSAGPVAEAAGPSQQAWESLLPLSARISLAEERRLPPSLVPDIAGARRVRSAGIRLLGHLGVAAACLMGMLRMARRIVPRPAPVPVDRR